MDKHRIDAIGNTIVLKKTISVDADINREIILDCVAASGVFKASLKYIPIVDALLDKMEPDTKIYFGTYESMSEELNISYSTVVRTFNALISCGVLERKSKGVYKFNTAFTQGSVEALRIEYTKQKANSEIIEP